MNIESVFTVFDLKTGQPSVDVTIKGAGQAVAKTMKLDYPPRKNYYVLEGHNVNGKFIPLDIFKN